MEIKISPSVPDSEVSREFIQGMADRMGVSFCKYGAVADAYPQKVDAIDSLKAINSNADLFSSTDGKSY